MQKAWYIEPPPKQIRFTSHLFGWHEFTSDRGMILWTWLFPSTKQITNVYIEIHEFTNKDFNFHGFTNDISSSYEPRTNRFHEFTKQFILFSRIHERKTNSRNHERRWEGAHLFLQESRLISEDKKIKNHLTNVYRIFPYTSACVNVIHPLKPLLKNSQEFTFSPMFFIRV